MRAVLDPNVLIASLLSPAGAPAMVVREWPRGGYELVVSPMLLAELERVLEYPKLRTRVTETEAHELVDLLRSTATVHEDGAGSPSHSIDPGDQYLLDLAATNKAVVVSGDHHLLDLRRDFPVYSPRDFLTLIEEQLAPDV